jgi:hypothetical protein
MKIMKLWSNATTLEGKRLKPGDDVSQEDLGLTDEEWQSLQDDKAVSEDDYPIPAEANFQGSPREWDLAEAAAAAAGEPTWEERKKEMDAAAKEADTSKSEPATHAAHGHQAASS